MADLPFLANPEPELYLSIWIRIPLFKKQIRIHRSGSASLILIYNTICLWVFDVEVVLKHVCNCIAKFREEQARAEAAQYAAAAAAAPR